MSTEGEGVWAVRRHACWTSYTATATSSPLTNRNMDTDWLTAQCGSFIETNVKAYKHSTECYSTLTAMSPRGNLLVWKYNVPPVGAVVKSRIAFNRMLISYADVPISDKRQFLTLTIHQHRHRHQAQWSLPALWQPMCQQVNAVLIESRANTLDRELWTRPSVECVDSWHQRSTEDQPRRRRHTAHWWYLYAPDNNCAHVDISAVHKTNRGDGDTRLIDDTSTHHTTTVHMLTSVQYRRPTEETEMILMIPLCTRQQLLTPLSRQNKFPDFSANTSSIRCKQIAPKIMLQFFQTTLRPLFAVQIDFFTVCL